MPKQHNAMRVCRPCHQELDTIGQPLLSRAYLNLFEQGLTPSSLLGFLVLHRTHSLPLRLRLARFQNRFGRVNVVFCSRSVHLLWQGHKFPPCSGRIALHVRLNHESGQPHHRQPNEQLLRQTNLLRMPEYLAHELPKPIDFRHQELLQFPLEPSWWKMLRGSSS